MQNTNFPFFAIVHDDCSTDNSADIIREYATKYPEIIRPIYEKENVYSKSRVALEEIMYGRVDDAKYIAICEGDDYWTDSLKLQKQVDYMEAHPECSLCFHNALTHWDMGDKPDTLFAKVEDRDYAGPELVGTWYTPTASFLFRSECKDGFIKMMTDYPAINAGDIPLVVTCAKLGIVHGMSDIMSVYNKHEGGWTNFSDARRTYDDAYSWDATRKAFGDGYYGVTTQIMTGLYLCSLNRAIRQWDLPIAIKALYRGILRQPITGLTALASILWEKAKQ